MCWVGGGGGGGVEGNMLKGSSAEELEERKFTAVQQRDWEE